jgi:hypothetical protein
MIQDVRTRWNSTFQMLVRAVRLRNALKDWIRESDPVYLNLYPTHEEWDHIRYVISVLEPFFRYTLLVSSYKQPTLFLAWIIYNRLFTHLETLETYLQKKHLPWKISIRSVVQSFIQKLQQYYAKTTYPRGLLYNLGTVLNPVQKLDPYKRDEWGPEYYIQYMEEAKYFYNLSYRDAELPGALSQRLRLDGEEVTMSEIDRLFSQDREADPIDYSDMNEMEHYLGEEPVQKSDTPLEIWKKLQTQYPNLARMARDVLAVPIASVTPERVFSMARDVIPSKRNRLDADRIKDIMISKYWLQKEDDNDSLEDLEDNQKKILEAEKIYQQYEANLAKDGSISDDEEEENNLEYESDHYNSADESQENSKIELRVRSKDLHRRVISIDKSRPTKRTRR